MQERNDISLVIVDAVSPTIDQAEDVAFKNIQELVSSGITDNDHVFEFYVRGIRNESIRQPALIHSGRKESRSLGEKPRFEIGYMLNDEVILTGGSLNEDSHYQVFLSLIQHSQRNGKIPNIHIPLDCTYLYHLGISCGEDWAVGFLANPNDEVFQQTFKKYQDAMRQYGPSAYVLNINGKPVEQSRILTLNIWNQWKTMVWYFHQGDDKIEP